MILRPYIDACEDINAVFALFLATSLSIACRKDLALLMSALGGFEIFGQK